MNRVSRLLLTWVLTLVGMTGAAWGYGLGAPAWTTAGPVAEYPGEPGAAKDAGTLSMRAQKEAGLRAVVSSSRPAGPTPEAASPAIEPEVSRSPQEEWMAHRKRKWVALTAAQHAAATFDAWSTRRAVRAGAREMNPLLRPVAGSNAIQAAIHVTPVLTDYLGRRMATSEKRWLRRLWWVPQAASTAVHVSAGINNLGSYRQATR